MALVVGTIVADQLGPDPAKELVLLLGNWAIRFLILALLITPLYSIFRQKKIIRFRRMIGLYAWFYALLHMLAYGFFLLNWSDIWVEFSKRPFIFVGLMAFIILTTLAATSNKVMMKKLGKRWKPLHRMVYVAAILVCLHVLWLARSDLTKAVFYSAIFTALLLFRLPLRKFR